MRNLIRRGWDVHFSSS